MRSTRNALRDMPGQPGPDWNEEDEGDDQDTQAAPWHAAEVTGQQLGAYVMYEEIARGGMAAVHLGCTVDPDGPRAVAIKHLDSQLARSANFVAMFVDEGRLAARIRHPNVVPPIDFVFRAAECEMYLVMEYVHGETLAHLLGSSVRQRRRPEPQVGVGIMVGVLRGLHAAHEATTREGRPMQIVHRDVSPQNIMVGTDGVARVLDFGVAKATTMQELSNDERERLFKPSYVSPEQIRNHAVDRRADIFSAGVVLWELLAGRRLFPGGDDALVKREILAGEIPPPSHYDVGIPAEVDAVVLRALACDREHRFATASDFAEALIATIEPAGARKIAAWVRLVGGYRLARRAQRVARMMSGAQAAAPARETPPAKLRRGDRPAWRRAWRRWGAIGLLAALVGVALWSSSDAAISRAPLVPVSWSSSRSLPLARSVPDAIVEPARVIEPPPLQPSSAAPPQPSPQPSQPSVEPSSEPSPRSSARQRRMAVHESVADVANLNRRALEAFRLLDAGGAQKLLRKALVMCGRKGLGHHRIAALTHAHLAVILVGGFNQSQLGVEHFRQALRINPMVPLRGQLGNPATAAAFREAVASMRSGA